MPARALRFRLFPAAVTLPEGLPERAGVPVRLTASGHDGLIRLASDYGGRERSVELAISPAYGWIMVLPFEVATGTGVRWITALGLALACAAARILGTRGPDVRGRRSPGSRRRSSSPWR